MKRKKVILLFLIICILGIFLFIPKNKQKEIKISTISYYHPEYKKRYDSFQKSHPNLNKEKVVTFVNMNRDYDFYQKIIKQKHPNYLNTLVNKYYQLDENYKPFDLIEINTNTGSYENPYRKHTARKVVYEDFQALKQACANKGFELYVTSGYRSTSWQKEIYNHMVETYSVERADETCSRPGHSEHTTGLGLDIALDQYKYEDVEKHPQYTWLLKQLSSYGFILRYPEGKDNLTGYRYEAWHIRYVGKALAKKIKKSGLTFDEYYARHYS
ncbi:MAG: M15 family metallopeptidase [Bacillota bacterium]|nr:M15 family metallopeptidase [Bacillota bacterium]